MVQSSGIQKPSNLWEETDEDDDANADDDIKDQWAFNEIGDVQPEIDSNRLSNFMLGKASEVSVENSQQSQAEKQLLENKVNELFSQINAFQSQIGEKDVQLMRREGEVMDLRGQVRDRDSRIQSLDDELRDMENDLNLARHEKKVGS